MITKEFLEELRIQYFYGWRIWAYGDLASESQMLELINLAKKGLEYDELKAKLDKAVKALEMIATHGYRDTILIARETLKELNAD